ncbi:UDP-glucosyltransferase A1 [Colletotrichum siamense]|uniref:UDP-glucosyltransferase A1 n=1 Tax=Colletotrichum siamense TaxID=690259 RepID=A0A9P5EDL6_COLSI|nr:UDP-glucosyltransferase A1 [Colletotrichum siamense]KAF4847696.1 UDP-glucosyltransferase A1 [Colletotrichum siamense]
MTSGVETPKKPLVLMLCSPAIGHMNPMLQIAKDLVHRGHDVSFLASEGYREQVERTGAFFLPHRGFINYQSETDLYRLFPQFADIPRGLRQLLWIHEKLWINSIPSALESIRAALASLRKRDPQRQVIVLCESMYSGILPLKLGAELPDGYTTLPPTLGISIIPAMWASVDTGPFGFGLPADDSNAGRMRNIVIAKQFAEYVCKESFTKLADVLQHICGTTKPLDSVYGHHAQAIHHGLWDASWACHDLTLQMCIPALELSRSDWPSNFKFGGALPRKEIPSGYQYPVWWDEIVANSTKHESERKKVVFVAQGTVVQDYGDMILPTIRGLANRDDLIVMAVLGAKGAELRLKDDETLPLNTRVVDYLLYDAALEYSDVFAVTGGYGALTHGVTNGVPMVLAGDSEDKIEVSLRGEMAGCAISLRTGKPSQDEIVKAVTAILENGKYRSRAQELKREAAKFSPMDIVEREMLALLK